MVRPPLLKLGTMGPQPVSKDVAPVFLPGELYGQRCLVGYSPQGRKELDMAEQFSLLPQVLQNPETSCGNVKKHDLGRSSFLLLTSAVLSLILTTMLSLDACHFYFNFLSNSKAKGIRLWTLETDSHRLVWISVLLFSSFESLGKSIRLYASVASTAKLGIIVTYLTGK